MTCSCGGIGRRNGLKIRRGKTRTGSSPVTSTTYLVIYRGVEQLVACRAHNPKVARFESRLRNHMKCLGNPGHFFLQSVLRNGRGKNRNHTVFCIYRTLRYNYLVR